MKEETQTSTEAQEPATGADLTESLWFEQAIQAKTVEGESNFHAMASFPVMLFLITLLLPSRLTEGRVLTQTQKESMVSDDHKTHVKTAWDKIDCPCELSIKDTLQRNFCASHQYQTAFEDLTNDNQHLSALLISLRKCCDYEYQVDQVNFSNMATGSKGPELGNNKKYISFYPLEECLNLAITVLLFH
ncbi:hypothetical protein NN561_016169 [Cricetulus griseus]